MFALLLTPLFRWLCLGVLLVAGNGECLGIRADSRGCARQPGVGCLAEVMRVATSARTGGTGLRGGPRFGLCGCAASGGSSGRRCGGRCR